MSQLPMILSLNLCLQKKITFKQTRFRDMPQFLSVFSFSVSSPRAFLKSLERLYQHQIFSIYKKLVLIYWLRLDWANFFVANQGYSLSWWYKFFFCAATKKKYFPSISYYFHIPKIFLNFFPHTGKNRTRRKSNLLP